MEHEAKIGGRKVVLKWNQETAKRFHFRLGTIGGHPTQRELTGAKTRDAAFCKVLWAMLPADLLGLFPSPEELFVAIDQETESEALAKAVLGIYRDMQPDAEKKSTSMKSHSPESNSG